MYPTRLYREQHTRIRALCAPLAAAGRASASSAEIRSALAKLAGIVKLHLRDEDMQLYPRLFKHEDRAVREVATTFRATMGSLAEDFRSFYERWIAPGTLELHRERFFAEADEIIAALLRRMDREDLELYDLAERATAKVIP